jgi:hypothetical protein
VGAHQRAKVVKPELGDPQTGPNRLLAEGLEEEATRR